MGLAVSSQPLAPPALYRPRNPRATAPYQLLEAYYEDVKSVWEERFEKNYAHLAIMPSNLFTAAMGCDFVRSNSA